MVVTDIVDLQDYGVKDLTLEIADPGLCSLTLRKTDGIDTDKMLKGATFRVEYKPFARWSGEGKRG